MSTFPPDVLPIEHTLRFLDRVLPQRSRVLEVGCGRGALAARLQARGLEVTALDASPEAVASARALGVQAVAGDFLEFVAEPFDAVLFSRSLHHIASLPRAVDRAHALLGPGGLVIAEEFAVERMDRQTARWFYELRSLLEAAGLLAPDSGESLAIGPLERWFAEHDENPLHAAEDMLVAIGSRFEVERAEDAPYLYRWVCDRIEAGDRGARVAQWVFELESLRVEENSLRAIGRRMVARRRA